MTDLSQLKTNYDFAAKKETLESNKLSELDLQNEKSVVSQLNTTLQKFSKKLDAFKNDYDCFVKDLNGLKNYLLKTTLDTEQVLPVKSFPKKH